MRRNKMPLTCCLLSIAGLFFFQTPVWGGSADRHYLFYPLGNTNRAVIDGKLNEVVWKQSESLPLSDGFIGRTFPRYPASFQLAVAGNMLYLAIRSEDPDWKQQILLAENRDQCSWADDGVEIFIYPDGRSTNIVWYQLAPNLKGVMYDSKTEGRKTDLSFNCHEKIKTVVKDGRWEMELSLPLDDFGVSLKPGTLWRFNIARNKRSGTGFAESLDWSPVKNGAGCSLPMCGYVLFTSPGGFVEYFNKSSAETCETDFIRVLSRGEAKTRHEKERSRAVSGPAGELNWKVQFPENAHERDYAALSVKKAAEADITGCEWCEIKYRNIYPSNTLEAAYSYEGTDGKTYDDRFTLPHPEVLRGYNIVDFNVSKDGVKAMKEGRGWAQPKKMKSLTIIMKADKRAGDYSAQIGYIRMTDLTLRATEIK